MSDEVIEQFEFVCGESEVTIFLLSPNEDLLLGGTDVKDSLIVTFLALAERSYSTNLIIDPGRELHRLQRLNNVVVSAHGKP